MGFLKKLGRKLGGAKKMGQKLTGEVGKIGKKAGRAMENVGKVGVVVGGATGIAPIATAGGALMAGGKIAQEGGQVLRDTSKGKLEKAGKGALSLAVSQSKKR